MDINWARIFNRLFEIINSDDNAYFSGGRFISKVREVDPYFPDYSRYIEERRASGKSTSRKDYYYDILLGFEEENRLRIINSILEEVRHIQPDKVSALQDELGGVSAVPPARLDADAWNADRLNSYLRDIDIRIASSNYEGAVTLAYTCLEGFLKAFVKKRIPDYSGAEEIISLSKAVRIYLRDNIEQYPDEAISMLNHIAHTVDRARNRFSESHFDETAGRWLAVFVRDLVHSEQPDWNSNARI
jgi:hypothetical protein